MSQLRRMLDLLPPRATTGIGSLPHTQLELALQLALQVDIPYLPQLPTGNPNEFMIPSALEGLPGLVVDAEGMCTIDVARWREGRAAFEAELEQGFRTGELGRFEPTPQACRAFRPFVWEIEHRKLALAKVQLAGPATVKWVTRTSEGAPISEVDGLEAATFRLVLARALAMAKAVRKAGATPLVYVDEPGLYALDTRDPKHLVTLQELRLFSAALQREGVLVGLHCCGNTEWGALLPLGFNLLSLDVRLSLDAVCEEREALVRFIEEGGALSLGVIPTNVASTYRVEDLVDSVDAALRATLPPSLPPRAVIERSVLTPACGLAMRSAVEAERTFEQLREAQAQLGRVAGALSSPA
jgi:methionine synthase II (cobalamin-independent)